MFDPDQHRPQIADPLDPFDKQCRYVMPFTSYVSKSYGSHQIQPKEISTFLWFHFGKLEKKM